MTGTLYTCVWVAIGGALGSVARFLLAAAVAALTGPHYPWGTLLINVLGSFVIGLFNALTAEGERARLFVPTDVRIFVMVGLCGGFTTFSAFSLQTLALMRDGEMAPALGYILASVILCLVFVWVGDLIGHAPPVFLSSQAR